MGIVRACRAALLAAGMLVAAWPVAGARGQCGPEWTQKIMTTREGAAVAYDTDRQRLLVFGGAWYPSYTYDLGYYADTWEFDDTSWTQVIAAGPSGRTGAAMAYDPVRRRMVLFGGMSVTFQVPTCYGDTWEYDGSGWTHVTTSGPSPRTECAMAFDPVRGRVLLFGGRTTTTSGTTVYGDTWEWTGLSWSPVTGSGPSSRYAAAMSTDSLNGGVVLFGGSASGGVSAETWTWNGAQWSQAGVSGPGPRRLHAMGCDPVTGNVILFGGESTTGYLGDTWLLQGGQWSKVTSSGPSARAMAGGAFDTRTGSLVIVGGRPFGTYYPTTHADVWSWKSTWHNDYPATPQGRTGSAMSYDSDRHEFVMFGGLIGDGSNIPLGDTWIHDGSRWRLGASTGPTPREHACMVYDSKRKRTVLFGGYDTPMQYGDTWEWNGIKWTQRSVWGPDGGTHAMAFDAARGVTVLHGGGVVNSTPKTWTYNGTAWTLRSTGTPAVATGASMAYDPVRQVAVLAGGYLAPNGTQNTDTWTWNGTAWTLYASTGPRRAFGAAVFMPDLGRVLYFSGSGTTGGQNLWLWEGSAWSSMVSPAGPLPRSGAAVAQGISGDRVLVFGGGQKLSDTWELRWPAPPAITLQPQDQVICRGGTAIFHADAGGTGPLSRRWARDGVELSDGPTPWGSAIAGSGTATLSVAGIGASDGGDYTCVVSSACDSVESAQAHLWECAADIDCSGFVDLEDFGAFVDLFVEGGDAADFDLTGFVDHEDFDAFVLAFELGC